MIIILLPAFAFVLTLFAHLLALKLFPRWGLLDFPERYQLKRARLPYPTGILCSSVFLLIFLLIVPIGPREIGVVIGIALLMIVNFIDDRTPLPFWLRLLAQVIACGLIFATGSRIYTITNPLGGFLKLDSTVVSTPLFGSLPVLSGIFTIGWLMLTINALNWFDGIPGQVSVISVIGFAMLGLLALLRTGEPELALIAFVLSGIALGAALFDFPPAKVLMGDSGSMFFGLMLGLLGVYQGGKVATAFLALGIPLIDALFVILSRIARGQSPFRGGHDHLHHRLLAHGWSARKVVILTAIISTLFGAGALFMSTAQKGIAAIVMVLLLVAMQLWISKKR